MSIKLERSNPNSAPFDAIADAYDDVFSNSAIGLAQRRAVWGEMDREFHAGQSVLEINCGTGIDAFHLAQRGVIVDACDSAPGMILQAQQRANASEYAAVRFRCLPMEKLYTLDPEKPYDGILSNFSGLNCIADLPAVVRGLARIVRPGARAVVCVFGSFCLWEVLWYLRAGHFRKAFRRLRRQGVDAVLAPDVLVHVHYRSVRSLRRMFAPYFRLKRCCGVGVALPPSYAGSIPERFPKLFRTAVAIDPLLGRCPGLWSLADHVVLTFERMGENL